MYSAGQYERARGLFEESYRAVPRGSTLRNWGLAEMKLGRLVDGFKHLRDACRAPDLTDKRLEIARQDLEDAYAVTGHVAIKTTDGALASVDDVRVDGAAPFADPIDVMPGKRWIEARIGDRVAREQVDALAGSLVEVNVALPETTAVAAILPPAFAPPLAASAAPTESPSDRESAPTTWWTTSHRLTIGLGATAVVATGVGIAFHIGAENAASDAGAMRSDLPRGACAPASTPQACAQLRDKLGAVHRDDTVAKVSWVVGGAAAAGAVIAFLAGPQGHIRTGSIEWRATIRLGSVALHADF